jgi:probable HAF family extracellular repeat protein
LKSFASAINNSGQVVGESDINFDNISERHAFLWENNVLYDLNELIDPLLGYELQGAFDINNQGQIIAYGIVDDEINGFLLTPVPIPATAWLFGSGLTTLLTYVRKKSYNNYCKILKRYLVVGNSGDTILIYFNIVSPELFPELF